MMPASSSLQAPAWQTLSLARLPLYARFVRVSIVDPPLAAAVGIAAGFGVVEPGVSRLLKVLLLFAMGIVLFYIVHALDDITGVRTGTDLKTAPRKARIGEPKLLASGVLSMREATRVVWTLAGVTVAIAAPVFVFAPPPAIVAIVLATVITGQYSYGARWSYRGLGELTVLLNFAACVIVPYLYITGQWSTRVATMGLLVGLSIVCVTFCSNFLDLEEDAGTGRKSLMVLLGVRRTKILFTAVIAAFWLVYAISWWSAVVPRGAAVVLVVLPLQGLALRHFWKDRPMAARRLCFYSNRLHAVLLAGAIWVHSLTV